MGMGDRLGFELLRFLREDFRCFDASDDEEEGVELCVEPFDTASVSVPKRIKECETDDLIALDFREDLDERFF